MDYMRSLPRNFGWSSNFVFRGEESPGDGTYHEQTITSKPLTQKNKNISGIKYGVALISTVSLFETASPPLGFQSMSHS